MNFCTTLYLPSINQEVRIAELKYEDFLTLQKFIINNNDKLLLDFLEYIISKYVDYKGYLSALDKSIILIYQRINSLSNQYTFSKDNQSFNLDLNNFLENLIDFQKRSKISIHSIQENLIEFKLNFPSKFRYTTRSEYLYDWIYSLSTSSQTINRSDFKPNIYDNIPSRIYQNIDRVVGFIEDGLSQVPTYIDKIISTDEPLQLNLSNGILLEVLKVFLRENLLEYYNKNHFLISKGHHSLLSLNQLSPAEVNSYYKMIEEEIQKINELDKTSKTE